jgi:hypothetical protein
MLEPVVDGSTDEYGNRVCFAMETTVESPRHGGG